MVAQSLNIIYDTNYVNIVPDGGFVDYSFTKKLWFWDLLFWNLDKKTDNSEKNEVSKTT